MISLAEAQHDVWGSAQALEVVSLAAGSALGLWVASDVASSLDVPPFDNSAVDGFAVQSSQTSAPNAKLRVLGTQGAGVECGLNVVEGTALRIMTGASIPVGADAVVMIEDCELVGDSVVVGRAVPPGAHIRRRAEDVGRGDTVIRSGQRVTPAVVGIVSMLGHRNIEVVRRPVVGVLSTGDELVEPGAQRSETQIYDSNRHMLLACCSAVGAETVDLGCVPDGESVIKRRLLDATEVCDVVLSSGGVSMGEFDYVKKVLGEIGQMRWMQVAIKPAKPLAFGTIGSTPVVGLPGNPVSSLVSFELFARPLIKVLMGDPHPCRAVTMARCERAMVAAPDKTVFARVRLSVRDGETWAEPVSGQGSHQLGSMAAANGLAVVHPNRSINTGEAIETFRID